MQPANESEILPDTSRNLSCPAKMSVIGIYRQLGASFLVFRVANMAEGCQPYLAVAAR